ncbi:choice-of-anchor J domain-containing protein [Prevotella merdae]|uniref:choice-of-anchor J domain-containing protein n=1 Tax=Prevotella merdae TaxID=2079531 RepID=UPI003564AFAC
MNKFLLTLASLALTTAASAQSLYSTDFAAESEFTKWTVIDANNDGVSWVYNAEGSQSKVFYAYSADNTADDWFISPEITPSVTGKVMVKYTTYGTSYGEKLEVYTGATPTIEGMTTLQAKNDKVIGERTTEYFFYEATEGVPFRVGFHTTSPKGQWRFYMCDFSVKQVNKVVDLQVDKVLSPQSADNLSNAETVKVHVVNKGLEASSNFEVAYQIDGGDVVKEKVERSLAPGEEMEYAFNTKADFSTERHKYALKAYTIEPNDINTDNDSTIVTVRHGGPVIPPYTWKFEPGEDVTDFKFYNLNKDDGDWEVYMSTYMNMARTGYGCLAYNYNKQNDANDWAMLDPIKVEAGNYVLRYWYSGSDGHTEKLGVYWGNGNTPADMTNKIDEQTIKQGKYQESFKVIKFDKPQIIYLGFYAHSDKDENWLTVDDVQFYKASNDAVDLVASEIVKPYDFVRSPNNTDVEFVIQNVGIKDADGKVIVTVDGEKKAEVSLNLKAQEIKNLTAKNVLKGLAEGKHTVKVTIESDDDNMPENNIVEKEVNVLGNPNLFYDFEADKIPTDLSFYVGDKGTVNPSAGEEFNEEGWGLFSIEQNAMLGSRVLAGTSWIDGDTPNRWIILPQVHVNSDNASFVWDAMSFNPLLLEEYSVKISDGSGNPADWWYTKATEVKGETIVPKTRGISLSKYKGKDIYIAFNLVTKKGEALCLDNIGVYGDVTTTGISNVNGDASGMFIVDNDNFGAVNAKSVAIVDLSGRTVLSVNSCSAKLADLQPGIYVGVAKYADGSSKTLKFIKK